MEKRRLYAFLCGLFQYAAGLGITDEAVCVLLEEKPFAHEFCRGSLHGLDVTLVVFVAFLERFAGIAFGHTLRFRSRERDKGTVETTKIWSPKTGCPHVPPYIGSQRHPYFH